MDETCFLWQRDAGPVLSHLSAAAAVCVTVSQALTFAQLRMYEAEQKAREAMKDVRMAKFECSVDRRFDGVNQRLDGVDKRLENIDKQLAAVQGQLGRLVEHMDRKRQKRWWR